MTLHAERITYQEIVAALCNTGYVQLQTDATRKQLSNATQAFEDLVAHTTPDERGTKQISTFKRHFLGSFPIPMYGRELFHYTPDAPKHNLLPENHYSDAFYHAIEPIYEEGITLARQFITRFETKFPGIENCFFPEVDNPLHFLRIAHTTEPGKKFPPHYDHNAVSITMYQSQPALSLGLTNETMQPIHYQEGEAVAYLGNGFEEYIYKDAPLGRHTVTAQRAENVSRTAILFFANVEGAHKDYVPGSINFSEANLVREKNWRLIQEELLETGKIFIPRMLQG